MSDARPARRPIEVDALSGLAAMPAHARELAIAEFLASRAVELAREARRVVRTHRVAPADRPAAHDAVTTAQQALLRDIAAGRRNVDPRSWAPTVRAESMRAVHRSATQGVFAVAPYRQRLATQRATLLAVRENATTGVPVAPGPAAATVRPLGGPSTVAPLAVSPDDVAPVRVVRTPAGLVATTHAGPSGPPRHARRPVMVVGRAVIPRRSLRWSTAALLSTVTIVVGAAVAPAEERPADGTSTSNVSFVDRLTMPIASLWDNLVGGGKVKDPEAVVPVPVVSPTPTAPPVQQPPAPTAKETPVAPAVPVAPPAPAAPVAPGAGTNRSPAPPEGGRHGNGSGWHDHDDMGRGEWHERDDEDDDGDDDDRRGDGHGRDEQRGQGRDDDRGDRHRSRDGSDRSRGRVRKVAERRHSRQGAGVPRA